MTKPHPTEKFPGMGGIRDDLDDARCFAWGIEAAIAGMECNDRDHQDGVRQLLRVHIEHLQAIELRLEKEGKQNVGI
jgi:hypothetical protein